METRIAILGILIEDRDASEKVNLLLHEYGNHIIGRMGIPHHKSGMSIITIVLDSTNDIINALSGKLGKIEHVQAKTMMTK